ncbi:hypothetical protein BDV36DRAFT_251282 [Aspergillus pseudocaelatus]|uniref:Uncharacterized protein n=1 Tax=Aspergillus pseudocaelatus TaxID=1825620 RepID=A0ABQ6WSL1_9EURO|nr:hypothetical protein BDV36DRAFT_251282 [Aspergillus pseudocaelatus]
MLYTVPPFCKRKEHVQLESFCPPTVTQGRIVRGKKRVPVSRNACLLFAWFGSSACINSSRAKVRLRYELNGPCGEIHSRQSDRLLLVFSSLVFFAPLSTDLLIWRIADTFRSVSSLPCETGSNSQQTWDRP